MQLIEPIIVANFSEELVYKNKPSYIIDLMILDGWDRQYLKYEQVFDLALKTIINQVKYN